MARISQAIWCLSLLFVSCSAVRIGTSCKERGFACIASTLVYIVALIKFPKHDFVLEGILVCPLLHGAGDETYGTDVGGVFYVFADMVSVSQGCFRVHVVPYCRPLARIYRAAHVCIIQAVHVINPANLSVVKTISQDQDGNTLSNNGSSGGAANISRSWNDAVLAEVIFSFIISTLRPFESGLMWRVFNRLCTCRTLALMSTSPTCLSTRVMFTLGLVT